MRLQTEEETESIEELLEKANRDALVKKQSPKFLPGLSDDELRQLAREKLSEALQAIDPKAQPEITRKLCAEVKDRLDGRAVQAVNVTEKITIVDIVRAMPKYADIPHVDSLVIDNEKQG